MSLLPPPEILRLVESQRVRLFPLAYRTNYQPCIKDNLALASSDPVQIRHWAREFQNCNWGMVTEATRVVIDVDAGGENGHARDGMASLDALIKAHGNAWLETPTVRSAGGGLHKHFAWPTGVGKITSTVSVLGNGIDVRASGGFCCLPPSTVLLADQTEADYVWERGDETTPPAPLPDWLLEKLLAPTPLSKQSPVLHGQNGNGKILQGVRNVSMFRFAAGLRGQGKEQDEILASCRRENETRYQPPLEDKEVVKHVNGTMKYPAGTKVVVTLDHPTQPDPPAQLSLIKTLAEYLTETPEKPEWVVTGLAARGAMTNLDPKIKTGKSTALLTLTKACLHGECFLGLPTVKSAVLFMTEQPSSSFRPALERSNLDAGSNLHILSLQDTRGLSWEAVLTMVSDYTEKTAISLLIVDTLGAWAGLGEGSENDSGAVLAALRPLQALLSQRLAIINSLHSRKSAGEVGDSARGSSALGGAADILITLSRLPGNPKNMRRLETRSRFEETPEELVIALEDGTYVVRGTPSSLAGEADRNWIADNLAATAEQALTESELLNTKKVSRSTLRRLLDHPSVSRIGAGTKKSPFRYYRTDEPKVTLGGKFIV